MQRFRGFKGFLFLMVFLPVLVMGGEECNNANPVSLNVDSLKIRTSPKETENVTQEASFNGSIKVFEEIEGRVLDDETNQSKIWFSIKYSNNQECFYINELSLLVSKNFTNADLIKLRNDLKNNNILQDTTESENDKFNDVDDNYPYKADIYAIAEKGIVNSPNEGNEYKFNPDKEINRAEFLKILILAQDSIDPSYYDGNAQSLHIENFTFIDDEIIKNKWYQPFVYFAKYKGIIDGYDMAKGSLTCYEELYFKQDGLIFCADKNINFSEASKIIVNTLITPIEVSEGDWWTPFTEQLHKFKDSGLKILINPIESLELTNNEKQNYTIKNAGDNITRGEMAHIINVIIANPEKVKAIKDNLKKKSVPNTDSQNNTEEEQTPPTTEVDNTKDEEIDNQQTDNTVQEKIIAQAKLDVKKELKGGQCKVYMNTLVKSVNYTLALPLTFSNTTLDNIDCDNNKCLKYNANNLYEWIGSSSLAKIAQYPNDNNDSLSDLFNEAIPGDIIQLFWHFDATNCYPHTILITKVDKTKISWIDSNFNNDERVKAHTEDISYFDKHIAESSTCKYNYQKYSYSYDKDGVQKFVYYEDKEFGNYGATLYRLKEQ